MTFQKVQNILAEIMLPGTKKGILAQKRISSLRVLGQKVSFSILLKEEEMHSKEALVSQCETLLKKRLEDDITIEIKVSLYRTIDSPLREVKNIIAVASGKGGVGKSTVTVNLAVALAKSGHKVGVVDADIYGPSIPKMFDTEGAKPVASPNSPEEKTFLLPVEQYGVKMLSIGYFVDEDQAVIWRGAMASNALKQMLMESDWGELDFLLIDLPPGTGDIHLSLVQAIGLSGAVIVSTPQSVALIDAKKGINMFRQEKINVPVLGLVENMAWFTPAELPDNRYYIFGKDGGKEIAQKMDIPLLGQIPIVQSIREGGDSGKPVALDEKSITGQAFAQLAQRVCEEVEVRNKTLPKTQKVQMDK